MAKDKSALDEHGTECAAQKNVEGLVQSENLAFVRTGLCHEKVGHGRLSLSGARCALQSFSMLILTQVTGNWQRTVALVPPAFPDNAALFSNLPIAGPAANVFSCSGTGI